MPRELLVRPLTTSTWPDFARVMEDHNGVWGGCWCISFHPVRRERSERDPAYNRSDKETLVREGDAHAALVYDGPDVVGWCQFGSPDELPRIKHKRAYLATAADAPDWRITCFFVARTHRGRGVADVALGGALQEIARLGGGTVESYPEDTEGRTGVSASFLHNATVSLFERHGFERTRRLGKHHWVVTRAVA